MKLGTKGPLHGRASNITAAFCPSMVLLHVARVTRASLLPGRLILRSRVSFERSGVGRNVVPMSAFCDLQSLPEMVSIVRVFVIAHVHPLRAQFNDCYRRRKTSVTNPQAITLQVFRIKCAKPVRITRSSRKIARSLHMFERVALRPESMFHLENQVFEFIFCACIPPPLSAQDRRQRSSAPSS